MGEQKEERSGAGMPKLTDDRIDRVLSLLRDDDPPAKDLWELDPADAPDKQ